MGKASRQKRERREAEESERETLGRVAAARRASAQRGAAEGRRRGCLFCRQSDGGFTSEEHIFPESLGNKEKVLSVGVVCDRCNHEVCAPLDEALCDFSPTAMMRTMHGIPSKSGKMPSFKFDNGSLHCERPGELSLNLDSGRWHRDGLPAPPGHVGWSFTSKRQDMTPKRLSKVHRALVKMALEYAWLDHGEERVLSSEFDRERAIVMEGGHRGYLLLPKDGYPDERTVTFTYESRRRVSDGHPLMGMSAGFWGIYMLSDTLFPEPSADIPEEIASVHPF
jgi:hypothetical protein